MIKGEIQQDLMTTDEIFDHTTGGYDIFKHYLGSVKRIMPRPWGKAEKHLSWGIYYGNGKWYYKDHATEESGTAIQFVQKFFNLDFKDAMNKIIWDFGLKNGTGVINLAPVKVNWDKPDIERDFCSIKFSDKPFQKCHHDFWNIVEVDEAHCRTMNCFAVKDLAIKGRHIRIPDTEPVFAYYCEEEKSVKIYFPMRRDAKFKNNVSYHYLWNYDKLEHCDNLIVQKSYKDLIVTTMITPCVIATQAEHVKIFNEEVVGKINTISKTPWIWYGSDDDGVKKCKEITGCNKWKYVNTPKNLLPDINDTYSYTAKYKLKGLEEFMELKKLIK